MSIVSSVFSADAHAQTSGARWVIEDHTDDAGKVHRALYLAAAGANHAAAMTARAARMNEMFADAEYRSKVQTLGPLNLRWQSGAEFTARLREDYRGASRDTACALAWWLIEMIAAGHVTDAQVRNAFGMTTPQYTAFKTRLQSRHDDWAAVLAAQGE